MKVSSASGQTVSADSTGDNQLIVASGFRDNPKWEGRFSKTETQFTIGFPTCEKAAALSNRFKF